METTRRKAVKGRFKTAAMSASYSTAEEAIERNVDKPSDWVIVEFPGGSFGCGHPSTIDITPEPRVIVIPESPALDEHTLSHVLSGVAEQERSDGKRMTDDELETELLDLDYSHTQIEQVKDAHVLRCTACGEKATHLYGALSREGTIVSMAGLNQLSLSCDKCADPESCELALDGDALVRAPLGFDWVPPYFDPGEDRMVVARMVKRYVERIAETTDYRPDSILINLVSDVRCMR